VLVGLVGCRMHADDDPGAEPTPIAVLTQPTPPAAPTPSAGAPGSLGDTPKLPEPASEGWNAAQIDWQPFDVAVKHGQAERKPICLVVYTTWCPHCRRYSHVFDDPRVVERARKFSMVRVDADQDGVTASRFAPDGAYIPRTLFLAPDGTLDASIRRAQPKYQYFYDEHDPASLVAAMDSALRASPR
jgi:protein-disulfide reductase (glutathione)